MGAKVKKTTYTISLGIDTEQYGRIVAFEVVFTELIAAHTYATIMIGTSAKPLMYDAKSVMLEDIEDILLSEKDYPIVRNLPNFRLDIHKAVR